MITFWRTRDKYGAFSNFWRCKLFIDNKAWNSSEHYYQAQKVLDPELQKQIRQTLIPKEAKKLAMSLPLREDWELIKYDIMKKALVAKFTQIQSLRELLLSTGEEEIGEDSPYDFIWGLGRDGSGQNLLGKALVEVREILRESV